MALKQEKRLLSLATPLGGDVLVLTSFSGREELSRLFSYQLDMISDNNAITAKDIVGKNVTWSISLKEGTRHFNGFVSRFDAADEQHGRRNYRAEVVPWLWFLTRTADCRIFQGKTVKDIIEQIFHDLGFSDFDAGQVKGSHPKRDYCVQYRETDFNFVSRLMEEEGIFYFFKHESGKHKLVLADQKSAYVDCVEKEVDYPPDFGSRAVEDCLTSWEHHYQFRTGKWAQTDYNFETPSNSLMTNIKSLVPLPGIDKYEVYDYPGEYGQTGDGNGLTKLRMEEEEAGYDVVSATSLCKSFTPGGKFKVRQHRSSSEEKKSYVITAIEHRAVEPASYETGSLDPDRPERDYTNRFTCIPDSVTFRPARTTPRPVVHGVQTAVVVGPGGAEIYTDKYGRVKVQFFWDREGKKDEKSSCWVRVAQNWAGKNWGIVFNPRIGQEVIVDFLEGDPDQPIIVGRVYNAEQMPPYALPGGQTKSAIKTRSSPGGGADNFNEIRFEDAKGSEEMYLHAEKDQNTVVEHDQTIFVGNDRHEKIGRDRSLEVGRDKSEDVVRRKTIHVGSSHTEVIDATMDVSVGGTLTESVGVNYVETVGVAMTLTVGAALAITVGAAMAETVAGAKVEAIGAGKSEAIGGNRSATVGGDWSESIAKGKTVELAKDLKETIGGQHKESVAKEFVLNAKKIELIAEDEVHIKTGDAEITMKKNGDITVKGNKINVKGDGDVIIKGSTIKEN